MATTLYGLANCDTCRKARNWLKRFDIAYDFVDYRDVRQSPETLVEWKEKLGGWEAVVNKSSTTWRGQARGTSRMTSKRRVRTARCGWRAT